MYKKIEGRKKKVGWGTVGGGLLDKRVARAGRVGKFVEFEPKAKEELFLGLKISIVNF